METTFDAVIVANGQFPTHAVPLSVLERAQHVVCCDGAIAAVDAKLESASQLTVIGDGDSVPDKYRHRLIQIAEQDDNDLTKATRYCIGQGWHRIAYLGCTGKREDHTLGNISLMMRYRRDFGIKPVMLTDQGFFTTAQGSHTFPSVPGQQVSIFNFGCTRIESEGLKWPSYAYTEWWQGTLNEALATQFILHADGCYMVFQTYQPKV